jgi:hypothetical protein
MGKKLRIISSHGHTTIEICEGSWGGQPLVRLYCTGCKLSSYEWGALSCGEWIIKQVIE